VRPLCGTMGRIKKSPKIITRLPTNPERKGFMKWSGSIRPTSKKNYSPLPLRTKKKKKIKPDEKEGLQFGSSVDFGNGLNCNAL